MTSLDTTEQREVARKRPVASLSYIGDVLMARCIFRLCAPLIAFALGSCSYVYDLKAVMINGRVAFVVDPGSARQPDCVRSIYVEAGYGEPKVGPVKGDNAKLVVNGGVYWWDFRETASCDNPFPIFYGDELKGELSEVVGYVAPKPLLVDVMYVAGTESRGSGYGTARFKIRADGKIENYRSDPVPPTRDMDRYIIRESKAG
ncbi:hypothetical protein MNQ96_14565 [Sphingopyxis granuli]|uniref:hypothetical protein n=1 Tax=Sphingopyxis granuli TaxID=267128 RepID=UPI001F52D515|nr:hypothetical protein [Sphingopyxis granuli]UNK78760.1 hypothetical protein MNQ96_14565 [Sphingopyxis granuli]